MRDLIAIGAAREDKEADQHFATELISRLGPFTEAASAIAVLQKDLFPQETKLRDQRAELLQPLQSRASRVHFDHTLETDEISITVKIRNADDFAALKSAITQFDYAAWQRHCGGERVDAD